MIESLTLISYLLNGQMTFVTSICRTLSHDKFFRSVNAPMMILRNLPSYIIIILKEKFKMLKKQSYRPVVAIDLTIQKKTQRCRLLHIGRPHDEHLEAFCKGISSCYAGNNLIQSSSHRHCYQYLIGAKLRLSDLPNDNSRGRIGVCRLTSRIYVLQMTKNKFNYLYMEHRTQPISII